MSDEQIRITIAEACDWEVLFQYGERNPRGYPPYANKDRVLTSPVRLPNYPKDLNACHEMERVLTDEQWDKYVKHLMRGKFHEFIGQAAKTFAHAKPHQRCEAFLRTFGKWKEAA